MQGLLFYHQMIPHLLRIQAENSLLLQSISEVVFPFRHLEDP